MDKLKKAHAISGLRRSTYKWRGRWTAEKRSHVGRGEYVCESCGQVLKKHQTAMDHIIPVVDPIVGWQGFDSFIDRLLVDSDGWQRLCNDLCHKNKTSAENKIRKDNKKKKS